ncbi:MAG: response regulator transcription factor [Pseudomonadota bacterium]
MNTGKLLLAEDDATLGSALVTALQREGWQVEWSTDGLDAYARLHGQRFDALLLDLGLPGLNGLDLLHRLRQTDPELPVIIVTAYADLRDRVRGLDFGADDYLAKPFELDELSARLRALTRRSRGQQGRVIKVRGLEVDLRSHQVRANGEPVWLTGREFSVLQLLLEHPEQPVSRKAIEQHLYGWGEVVEANTVDVFIYNLRRKLGRELIQTYRGSGYSIAR